MKKFLATVCFVSLLSAASVVSAAKIGIAVNGTDIGTRRGGPGWTFTSRSGELCLTSAGAVYVISGSNKKKTPVSIYAQADCVVVVSNLTVDASAGGFSLPALDCGTCTVDLRLWSSPGTTNVFKGCVDGGAGIRVASGAMGCASLVVTNLNGTASLLAQGGSSGAGIGGDGDSGCGTVTINGGSVTARGGSSGAGIGGGGGDGSEGWTVDDGPMTAWDGTDGAAGFGGGNWSACGTVTINGGIVTAIGGFGGAGIGDGRYSDGTAVTIDGGVVTAQGGTYGAGIGAGGESACGAVTISGGTLVATRGNWSCCDIGGSDWNNQQANIFTGGSIHPVNNAIAVAPTDADGVRVYCVTLGGFAVGSRPVVAGLSATYNVSNLVADASGNIYLWLPAGDYAVGGSSAAGETANTVVKSFSVSSEGAVVGPTDVALAITGFSPDTGVTNWSPAALSGTALRTLYSTNLVDWSESVPVGASTLFMKLELKQ